MRSQPIWANQMQAIASAITDPARNPKPTMNRRPRIDMHNIIEESADARPRQIEDHREIRREKKHGKEPPRLGELSIGDHRGKRDSSRLNADENARGSADKSAAIR